MVIFKKNLPLVFLGIILILVVWQVEPPKSLTSASLIQIIVFFLPFWLFLTFLINLFLKFLLRSLIISLGLTILLSLEALNFITIPIVILATVLTTLAFKKPKNLKSVNIPSLKLRKQR